MISVDLTEKVTTYDGTTAPRRDCRFIKGDFFIKNKQCFLVDGRWYRVNSGKIILDHECGTWLVKDQSLHLCYGVVECSSAGNLSFGYFTPNPTKNVYYYDGNQITTAIKEDIFTDNPTFREGVNGIYYNIKTPVTTAFTTKLRPRKEEFYSFPFNYDSEELIPKFSQSFKDNFVGDKLESTCYRLLEPYTWGIEFETNRGAIPERHLMKSGLIACRDGSIEGFEYATVPLSGETGIQAIKRACDLLNKYCTFSVMESLHIHVGGFPKTVHHIAALYRLCCAIQKDIYALFPYFYPDTAQFKRKSYCGPLYTVGLNNNSGEEIFNEIYTYLSGGEETFRKFTTNRHPQDRSGQHKWDVSYRYFWLNLIPLIWGTKGTVEFRCHTPTFNLTKVINWLFIVIAILRYAESHITELTAVTGSKIKNIALNEVIRSVYPPDVVITLFDYMKQRKAHYAKKTDATGEDEMRDEIKYSNNSQLFSLTPII